MDIQLSLKRYSSPNIVILIIGFTVKASSPIVDTLAGITMLVI